MVMVVMTMMVKRSHDKNDAMPIRDCASIVICGMTALAVQNLEALLISCIRSLMLRVGSNFRDRNDLVAVSMILFSGPKSQS
jgi:hypothetical protein